jgi:hypothetical protein
MPLATKGRCSSSAAAKVVLLDASEPFRRVALGLDAPRIGQRGFILVGIAWQ